MLIPESRPMVPGTRVAILVLLVFLTTLSTFCQRAVAEASEVLDWSLNDYVLVYQEGTGWKDVNGRETTSRIYSSPGATSADWKVTLNVVELPVAFTFMSNTRWNPESLMQSEQRRYAKSGCDDPWVVLSSSSQSLTYERTQVDCPGYLHSQELGRIVVGKWYAWWVIYRIRNMELSESARKSLIDHLSMAQVSNTVE